MSKQNLQRGRREKRELEGAAARRNALSAAGTRPAAEGARAGSKPAVTDAAPLELDRIVHERLRLGILSALAVNRSLKFNELKKLLNTTDGNLSVHARKLEEAEYVSCEKSFEGRVPKTEYQITASGRRALESYLDEMEALISATRNPKPR